MLDTAVIPALLGLDIAFLPIVIAEVLDVSSVLFTAKAGRDLSEASMGGAVMVALFFDIED